MRLKLLFYFLISILFIQKIKSQQIIQITDLSTNNVLEFINIYSKKSRPELVFPQLVKSIYGIRNDTINKKLSAMFKEYFNSESLKQELLELSKLEIDNESKKTRWQYFPKITKISVDKIKLDITECQMNIEYYFKDLLAITINTQCNSSYDYLDLTPLYIQKYYWIDLKTVKVYTFKDLFKPEKINDFEKIFTKKAKDAFRSKSEYQFKNIMRYVNDEDIEDSDDRIIKNKYFTKKYYTNSFKIIIDFDKIKCNEITPFRCTFNTAFTSNIGFSESLKSIGVRISFKFYELIPYLNEKGILKSMIDYQKNIKTNLKNIFIPKEFIPNKSSEFEATTNSKEKFIINQAGLPPNFSFKKIKTISIFNEYGNIRKIHFSRNNLVTRVEIDSRNRTDYKYDKNNNLVRIIKKSHEYYDTIDYKYDNSNNLLKITEKHFDDFDKLEILYFYVDTMIYVFGSNDALFSNQVISLSKYGEILNAYYIQTQPNFCYYYDSHKIKSVNFNNDNSKSGVFNYSSMGLLENFIGNDSIHKISYLYNNSSQIIKKVEVLNNDVSNTTSYYYNNDNLIEEIIVNEVGISYGTRYECVRGLRHTKHIEQTCFKYEFW